MAEAWESFGAPDETPAPQASTGVPFFGQGGYSIPPEALASPESLLDHFKKTFGDQRTIDPQNQAILDALGGGRTSALSTGAQLGSDALAGIGAGMDTAAEGLDRLVPGARIGSTLFDMANSVPFEGAALERPGVPVRPALGNFLRGADEAPVSEPAPSTLGVHDADFQSALRVGDPISAESALKAAGQPVDDATRTQIKSAMDYYKNGGTENTVWGNRAEPVTPEEAAQATANDQYEAAKASGDGKAVETAYDNLLKAHGQELDKTLPQAEPVPGEPGYVPPVETIPPVPIKAVDAPEGTEATQPTPDSSVAARDVAPVAANDALRNFNPAFDTPEYKQLAENFKNDIVNNIGKDLGGPTKLPWGPQIELADYMANNFNDSYGDIAKKVSESLQKLKDVGAEDEWQIYRPDDMLGGPHARGYAGENPMANAGTQVAIRSDSVTPETVLHELLHTTVTRVSNALDFIDAKGGNALRDKYEPELTALDDLKRAYRQVQDHIANNPNDPAVVRAKEKLAGTNALENHQEMMAWGMTNPEVQKLLSSIRLGKDTVMGKLLYIVQKMLGLTADTRSALAHVISATDRILSGRGGEAYSDADALGTRPKLPGNRQEVEGPGEPAPKPEADDVISRITDALKDAGKSRKEQEGLYTEARKAKIAQVREAAANSSGEEGFHSELEKLKGELPKVEGKNIREMFTPEEIDTLFDKVKNTDGLSVYEGIRGRQALAKLLDGEIPTNSEIQTLYKVFPADFIKEMIRGIKDIGGQGELFSGSEITSSGPLFELLPEPKPVDPDKYVFNKYQSDLFPDTREPGSLRPIPETKFRGPDGEDLSPKVTKPKSPETGLLGGIAALSRSLMASVDLSAPFTQGAFLVGRKEFWKSFGPMFKAAWSEQGFNGVTKSIEELPTYPLMEKGKLALSDINDGMTAGEEAFVGAHLAEKIPLAGRLVRGSERAYTAFLNKLRADTFNSIASKFNDAGIDLSLEENAKALKDLAGFINNATGKGDLGRFAPAGNVLGTALFSPRLMASRVNLLNPAYYVKLDPLVRKQAISSLLSMGGVALTVAGLAKMGGADVETDPRSSDFMKVKVGNTRYSLTGGFGPYLTLAARLVTNEKKDAKGNIATLGAKYGAPTRWDTVADFFANKASPAASFFIDWAKGKDHDFEPFSLPKEAIQHFTPLFLQDVWDVVNDRSLAALPMAIPGLFGVQTQTYKPAPVKAKASATPDWESFGNETAPAPTPTSAPVANQPSPDWESFK